MNPQELCLSPRRPPSHRRCHAGLGFPLPGKVRRALQEVSDPQLLVIARSWGPPSTNRPFDQGAPPSGQARLVSTFSTNSRAAYGRLGATADGSLRSPSSDPARLRAREEIRRTFIDSVGELGKVVHRPNGPGPINTSSRLVSPNHVCPAPRPLANRPFQKADRRRGVSLLHGAT